MLWSAAVTKGYACPLWLTFKQAIELGGHVRKGEAGELVVYANSITRTETDAKGEETDREIPYMKGYTVFNAEQCDGLPAHYHAKAEPPALTPMRRLDAADRFFAATGVEIRQGGARAYYAEGPDYVQMPPFETFRDAESYAAVLAHELTHSTKHSKRLARDLGRVRHGDEGYAREGLVAELGAAFLCADLGLTPDRREQPVTRGKESTGPARGRSLFGDTREPCGNFQRQPHTPDCVTEDMAMRPHHPFYGQFGTPHQVYGPGMPHHMHGGLGLMVVAGFILLVVVFMLRSRQPSARATAEGAQRSETSGSGLELGKWALETVMKLGGHRR